MTRPEFMPATPDLVEAYYGCPQPFTLRGWICMLDGRPVGACGVYWVDGAPIAFSEWRPELLKHRRAMAAGVRLVEGLLATIKVPIYAVPNLDQPNSAALLAKLGFVPEGGDALGGELMVRA